MNELVKNYRKVRHLTRYAVRTPMADAMMKSTGRWEPRGEPKPIADYWKERAPLSERETKTKNSNQD